MVNLHDPSTTQQQAIEAALARFAGDVVRAADDLGVNVRAVQAVWQRMSKIDKQKDGLSSLEKALARHDGSLVKAAADLGISVQAARDVLQRLHTDATASQPRKRRPQRPRRTNLPEAQPTESCGTPAAYRRHYRNGERADQKCRDAYAAEQRDVRAKEGQR